MLVDRVQNEPLLEKERAGFVDAKVANASRFHSIVAGRTWASIPALAAFVEDIRALSSSSVCVGAGAGTSWNAAKDTATLAMKGASPRSNSDDTHGPAARCGCSNSRSRIAGFTALGFQFDNRFKTDIFISCFPS